MSLAGWYFVSLVSAGAYIGPMTASQCQQVSAAIPHLGMCREAKATRVCAVDGRPGSSMACPDFGELPAVTVKPQ
jgi:hypothetical protein